MKVLFLDFDGVLNIFPNPSKSGNFHKPSCINLEMLLGKVPDLKIVVSSSWRIYGLDAVRDILKSNGIDPRRVIDITGYEQSNDNPDHIDNRKGYQVECWLKKHPEVKKYVCVDDENDYKNIKDKLVKTDRYVGLTQANVEKILMILGE